MEKPKLVRMLDNADNRSHTKEHGYLWWQLEETPRYTRYAHGTMTGRFRSVATGFEQTLRFHRFEEVEDA